VGSPPGCGPLALPSVLPSGILKCHKVIVPIYALSLLVFYEDLIVMDELVSQANLKNPSKTQPGLQSNGQENTNAAPGKCLVIFGTKGGVGKTVVATNLAVAMAIAGKRVCLLDLDMMATGDAAKMLGLTPQHEAVELAPLIKKSPDITQIPLDGLVIQHDSGVGVIQCVTNPRHGNLLDDKLLKLLFSALKRNYEYVIVDAGKGLTDQLILSFDESNLILLVATPDIVSLYQTKWAMNIIESLLFPAQMVKAVLNRAASRGGVGSQDARMALPCELIGEIPSDGRAVGTAVNQGEPVLTLFASSKVSEGFRELAKTLIENPKIFIPHQDIARHQRSTDGKVTKPPEVGSALSRLFSPTIDSEDKEDTIDEIVLLKRRVHRRLVDELDLKRGDISFVGNQSQLNEMRVRCEKVVAGLLAREIGGIISSHEVRKRLVKEIIDEALGLGPLEELLADDSITDILVNNKDQIYVERKGKLELTSKKFISDDQVRAAATIKYSTTDCPRRLFRVNILIIIHPPSTC